MSKPIYWAGIIRTSCALCAICLLASACKEEPPDPMEAAQRVARSTAPIPAESHFVPTRPKSAEELLSDLNSPDIWTKVVAAEGLYLAIDTKRFAPRLIPFLSADPRVADNVARALKMDGDEATLKSVSEYEAKRDTLSGFLRLFGDRMVILSRSHPITLRKMI